ncbi:MAG: EthD family reductase [Chitinophagaceae bacterium]|nr:EthD family reductase [Chitinophagaceae bacterium]
MSTRVILFVGLVALVGLLLAFRLKTPAKEPQPKKGMIKVTILYPNAEGKKFDMDYYSSKHMPMVASLLGDSLKSYGIDKGVAGRNPGDPIPYVAIGYLYFDRLSAYQNSFRSNAEKIRGDIPNYTDIQPVVQISEVVR